MSHPETITRRNLPHWFVPHAWHFVTYRVAGTIPAAALHRMREMRDAQWREATAQGAATSERRSLLHKQFFAAYDRYLDHESDVDWLLHPPVAAMIRGNLYHHCNSKYQLLAYCIMPNHVHVLLRVPPDRERSEPSGDDLLDETPDGNGPLASIMHSLKSYTANEANKILKRTGQFWQHESFDHWVRDADELERIVAYIAWNPVKAKLVLKPHNWHFGSAMDRFLQDGSEEGHLVLPEQIP
ncbi:MAG: hypothetical protein HYR84_14750 [Planctomycetes bacterium]|nr:hypothetical protein [Planctomycetota bacterium]